MPSWKFITRLIYTESYFGLWYSRPFLWACSFSFSNLISVYKTHNHIEIPYSFLQTVENEGDHRKSAGRVWFRCEGEMSKTSASGTEKPDLSY